MRVHLSLLLFLVAAVLLNSCAAAGKSLAGGPGDPNLYDTFPLVPSIPVQLGTYVVRATKIVTNPPNLLDRFQALGDTLTITISAGPSSYAIGLKGEYLDPRINDLTDLRDRGGNVWTGINNRLGTSQTIVTDAAGAPQQYIIGTVSTSTLGTTISAQRTFSFGYGLGVNPGGLYIAFLNADDDFTRPLNVGQDPYFVISQIGLAQWEQDKGINFLRYWTDLSIPGLRGQFTQYNPNDDPQNIEEEDILFKPYFSMGQRNETNHADGTHVQSYGYIPLPGIVPINSGGTWHGVVSSASGIYLGHPYFLTVGNSTASFTVNAGALTVPLDANATINTLHITSLSGPIIDPTDTQDTMIAVRAIGAAEYEIMTLQRNTPADDTNLTESGCALLVSTYAVSTVAGQGDQLLGQYEVTNLLHP